MTQYWMTLAAMCTVMCTNAVSVRAQDTEDEQVVRTLGAAIHEPQFAPRTHEGLTWREDWPRFGFDEAVLTLGVGMVLVSTELLPTVSFEPNLRGGFLFDDAVRSGLRLRGQNDRSGALVASDVLMWTLVAFPFAVDALAVAGIGNQNWDAAFQMGLIGLESYVLSLIVWKVTVLLARRERPADSACGIPGEPSYCRDRQPTQAFFSNQAMNAFTGASLTCLQHQQLPLFGGGSADTTACVAAIALATTVGALRVMSDFEYLSDVLVGAAVGMLAGYLVPWILHYQGGALAPLAPPTEHDDLQELDAAEQSQHHASSESHQARTPATLMIPVPMLTSNDGYGVALVGIF